MRGRVANVQCLLTYKRNIMLRESQYFCHFNDSWEIWGPSATDDLVCCLERIPDNKVVWVIKKLQNAKTATA